MRCLPYWIVIGMEKAGSSAIHYFLGEHPDIVTGGEISGSLGKARTPGRMKEYHFFNLGSQAKGKPRPANDTLDYLSRLGHPLTSTQVTGESSPGYAHGLARASVLPFSHLMVPDRVYELNPDMKSILLVRDPVDLAWSQYAFFIAAQGSADPEVFDKSVRGCGRTVDRCEQLAESAEDQEFQTTFCVLQALCRYQPHGIPMPWIKNWVSVFPPDQLMIVFQEDMRERPLMVMRAIESWMGLSEYEWPDNVLDRTINTRQDRGATRAVEGTVRKGSQVEGEVDMWNSTRRYLENWHGHHSEGLGSWLLDNGLKMVSDDWDDLPE